MLHTTALRSAFLLFKVGQARHELLKLDKRQPCIAIKINLFKDFVDDGIDGGIVQLFLVHDPLDYCFRVRLACECDSVSVSYKVEMRHERRRPPHLTDISILVKV